MARAYGDDIDQSTAMSSSDSARIIVTCSLKALSSSIGQSVCKQFGIKENVAIVGDGMIADNNEQLKLILAVPHFNHVTSMRTIETLYPTLTVECVTIPNVDTSNRFEMNRTDKDGFENPDEEEHIEAEKKSQSQDTDVDTIEVIASKEVNSAVLERFFSSEKQSGGPIKSILPHTGPKYRSWLIQFCNSEDAQHVARTNSYDLRTGLSIEVCLYETYQDELPEYAMIEACNAENLGPIDQDLLAAGDISINDAFELLVMELEDLGVQTETCESFTIEDCYSPITGTFWFAVSPEEIELIDFTKKLDSIAVKLRKVLKDTVVKTTAIHGKLRPGHLHDCFDDARIRFGYNSDTEAIIEFDNAKDARRNVRVSKRELSSNCIVDMQFVRGQKQKSKANLVSSYMQSLDKDFLKYILTIHRGSDKETLLKEKIKTQKSIDEQNQEIYTEAESKEHAEQQLEEFLEFFSNVYRSLTSEIVKFPHMTEEKLDQAMKSFDGNKDFVFRKVGSNQVRVISPIQTVEDAKAKLQNHLNKGAVSASSNGKGILDLRPSSQPPISNSSAKKIFVFAHSKTVYIYQQNIVQARVDAIVNAANGRLAHGSGVAGAIASAAGYRFCEEGFKHIESVGPLAVSQVYSQRAAGSLLDCGIKFVIHVVGPDYLLSREETQCKAELAQAVLNSLVEAERLGCCSVAIPAISSGIYGVPMGVCTAAYFEALLNFTSLQSYNSRMREIHFVNIDEKTNSRIQQDFEEYYGSTEAADFMNISTSKQTKSGPGWEQTHPTQSTSVDVEREVAKTLTAALISDMSHDTYQAPGGAIKKTMTERSMPNSRMYESRKSVADRLSQPTRTILAGNVSQSNAWSNGPPHKQKTANFYSVSLKSDGSAYDDKSLGKEFSHNIGNAKPSQNTASIDKCSICLESAMTNPRTIKCGHIFCHDCIGQWEKMKGMICPNCTVPYGAVIGDQPKGGTMTADRLHSSLPGYSQVGTILINYSIPGGQQEDRHPNPGTRYYGIQRAAYLPDNERGHKVLKMLRKAFDARLVFTVGQSRTTGATDQITWNDIHHKTSTHGGTYRFGYPDSTYLDRVEDELRAKGITSD